MKITIKYSLFVLLLILPFFSFSQNVGIGTESPTRTLEVYKPGNNYARISSLFGNSGLELTRQGGGFIDDWRIVNNAGVFKLETSPNDIGAYQSEILRVTPQGKWVLGRQFLMLLCILDQGPMHQIQGAGI